MPSVEELEAAGALLGDEVLRADLMDHIGLRRAFEADREREAFLVERDLEDPFDVPLEDSAPPLEVHGATYIPARHRALVGILVHAHAEHLGIRLDVQEIGKALPEFIFNDAPPRSGFGKLRDRVHREQLWGLNPDSLAKDILADLLFDGVLGDEPQAFLRADGFRVPVARDLAMGDVKLGGWPMFPEHDDARILEFTRPDPSAPRWAEKHERRRAEGAAGSTAVQSTA